MAGYIKPVGNAMRMRFVKPGYNPDSEAVPANAVIFDSRDIGTLTFLTAGEYQFSARRSTQGIVTIASWSLTFVPLCVFSFRLGNDPWRHSLSVADAFGGNLEVELRHMTMLVTRTGIRMRAQWATTPTALSIRWVAFRTQAT